MLGTYDVRNKTFKAHFKLEKRSHARRIREARAHVDSTAPRSFGKNQNRKRDQEAVCACRGGPRACLCVVCAVRAAADAGGGQ